MAEPKIRATLGDTTCPLCGCATVAKESTRGFAYIHCPPEVDGGCNTQTFGRSPKSNMIIAKRITKWRSPDLRKRYLNLESASAPETENPAPPKKKPAPTAPPQEPPPPEAPEPEEAETETPWYDKELL